MNKIFFFNYHIKQINQLNLKIHGRTISTSHLCGRSWPHQNQKQNFSFQLKLLATAVMVTPPAQRKRNKKKMTDIRGVRESHWNRTGMDLGRARPMFWDDIPQVVEIWRDTGLAEGTQSVHSWYRFDPDGFYVVESDQGGCWFRYVFVFTYGCTVEQGFFFFQKMLLKFVI